MCLPLVYDWYDSIAADDSVPVRVLPERLSLLYAFEIALCISYVHAVEVNSDSVFTAADCHLYIVVDGVVSHGNCF